LIATGPFAAGAGAPDFETVIRQPLRCFGSGARRDVTELLRQDADFTERYGVDSQRLHRNHATLVVLQGPEIGRDFRLRRGVMTIGRGLDADIRVPDDLASRRHARIEYKWDARAETAPSSSST